MMAVTLPACRLLCQSTPRLGPEHRHLRRGPLQLLLQLFSPRGSPAAQGGEAAPPWGSPAAQGGHTRDSCDSGSRTNGGYLPSKNRVRLRKASRQNA